MKWSNGKLIVSSNYKKILNQIETRKYYNKQLVSIREDNKTSFI